MPDTFPYSIVVPALVLNNERGEQRQSVIDCERKPIDLAAGFCIEFWFRPGSFPRRPSNVGKVFTTSLKTADGGKRELVLWLHENSMFPELYMAPGPKSAVPPLNEWTHLAFSYARSKGEGGKFEVMYWHARQLLHQGSVDFHNRGIRNEAYHLTKLVLCAENLAVYMFSELRLWQSPKDQQSLADYRQRPLDGNELGLVGYWKLDEGSGTLMVDSSGGGNDGTIQGGEWQRDSGLELQMGMAKTGGQRYHLGDGKATLQDNQRAQWISLPRLDPQIAHLDTLLTARQRVMEQANSQLQTRKSELSALEIAKVHEEDHRSQKQRELEGEVQQKLDAVRTQREEVEKRKQETLARIESSRRIHLKDFILRLEEDIARGRENIREQYGRVYGLDTVSMDVKVVPGVGGVGLHLPDPDTRIDPSRLSTLKLRFRAGPAEGEDKPKLATVPGLEGGTEDFARRKLAQAGFRVDAVYQEVVDPIQDGRILAQIYDAKEGGQAELDSVITLVVGRRP